MTLIEAIKQHLSNSSCSIISFDIFDTLLLLPYAKTTDLFLHLSEIYNCPNFFKVRIQTEELLRKNLHSREEITFDEIYQKMSSKYLNFKTAELDLTNKLAFANAEMKEMYDYAISLGKEVIITSDIYLPEDFIIDLLHKNGYTNYKKLYISSVSQKTKRTGSIFKYIMQDLNVNANAILHIGDNYITDYMNSKELGLDAIYYPSRISQLFKSKRAYKDFYEKSDQKLSSSIICGIASISHIDNYWGNFGFLYGGPVVFAYVNWLNFEFIKNDISQVIFAARDGYSLQKIFELIKTKSSIKSNYVYASRALANIKKDEYMKYFKTLDIDTSKNVAIVDSVSGYLSAQKLLERNLGKKLKGYYWFTTKNTLREKEYFFKTYSKHHFQEFLNWKLMEFILSAPEPPVINIKNGNIIYSLETAAENERINIYKNIYIGILDFCNEMKTKFSNIKFNIKYNTIVQLINSLYCYPEDEDRYFFYNLKFASDMKHEKYDYLCEKWRNKMDTSLNYSYIYQYWHSDTEDDKQREVNGIKNFLVFHNILPKEKNAKVLELGCGMGRWLLALKSYNYDNLKGIDVDASQISIAKKEGLNVELADAHEFLESNNDKYDVIYCIDVLEHVDKDKQVKLLREINKHLTNNGFVVLRIPNVFNPTWGMMRYEDFTHCSIYTDRTINFLLNNSGFSYVINRPTHQETIELESMKKYFYDLYKLQYGRENIILTPNMLTVAFKNELDYETYKSITQPVKTFYEELENTSNYSDTDIRLPRCFLFLTWFMSKKNRKRFREKHIVAKK